MRKSILCLKRCPPLTSRTPNSSLTTGGSSADPTSSTTKVVGGGSHADKSNGQNTGTGSRRDNNVKESNFRSWEIHSYTSPDGGNGRPDFQLATKTRLPILRTPTDVLIRVHASSVNPIDVAMTRGYGQTMINVLRDFESSSRNWTTNPDVFSLLRNTKRIEFPLVLGRDFSGVVTRTGLGTKDLVVGDEVYGVVGVQNTGCHSDFVVTSTQMVRKKPKNLNFVEAASLPYVGLTTWSALRLTGGFLNLENRKFLVLGGSGGVGSFLIQYLKANGSYVVSTCSSDAVPLVESFGCDFAVDYGQAGYSSQIQLEAPFDCIVDLTGSSKQSELISFLRPGIGQYITLSPPFLSNFDKFGICGGLARNLNDIVWTNWKSMQSRGIPTKWAFFVPFGRALENFTKLVESGQIKPAIQEVFNFEDLPDAYSKLEEGHARGKIVIDFQGK